MKNFTFLLLTIVGFQSSMIGQSLSKDASIKWSNGESEYKIHNDEIIASDEDGFYNLDVRKKSAMGGKTEFVIEQYDLNAKLLKTVPLDLEYEDNELNYAFTAETEDNILIFTTFDNKKQDTKYLFYKTIDKKSMTPSQQLVKVSEIKYGDTNFAANGYFSIISSEDDSKICIKTTYDTKKKDRTHYNFEMFDGSMNALWNKEIEIPFEQGLFLNEGTRIDNNGNLYIYGVEFKEKRVYKRKGDPNYTYHIFTVKSQGNEVDDIPVSIDASFITDMRITLNDQSEIICAGFYSEVGTFTNKGSFFLKFDSETNERLVQKQKPFSMDLIKETMSQKEIKKTNKKEKRGKDVELEGYDLHSIVIRDDGGAVLTAQESYSYTVTTTDANGRTRSTTYYIYNDILVVNYNPDGSIEWVKKIAKKQRTANDGGIVSSFSLFVKNNTMYFLFNDNPNNLYYKSGAPESFPGKSKEYLLMLVEMDMEGNQKRSGIYTTNRKKGAVVRPSSARRVSDNQFVMIGYKKKTRMFGVVTLK